MKILKTLLAASATLTAATAIGGYRVFQKASYREKVKPKKNLEDRPLYVRMLTEGQAESNEWLKSIDYKEVSVTSDDGLVLKGVLLRANKPTENTVILVHGYKATWQSMGFYARYYLEDKNYNVLMFDQRAHGTSQGDIITFGYKESRDLVCWIELVLDYIGLNSQIILHGVSMGGATVLMASALDLPKQVVGVVSDCAYSSYDKQLNEIMYQDYKLPGFPLVNVAMLYAKFLTKCDHIRYSPLTAVKKAKLPILFIHGEKDSLVPFYMVTRLFNACVSEKTLLAVPLADHAVSWFVAREDYCLYLTKFLNDNVKA